MFRQYIQTGMADVHRRIVAANYFKGLSPEAFARTVGPIMGDINYVHPFREGNGRVCFTSSSFPLPPVTSLTCAI
jgi:cell filamentation protein